MHCTCSNLDASEFKIIFSYDGIKATPYIDNKAKQYIGDHWPQTGEALIYLLCEEMHYQCKHLRAFGIINDKEAWISRFACCKPCGHIRLSRPTKYDFYRVNGIPVHVYSDIKIPVPIEE